MLREAERRESGINMRHKEMKHWNHKGDSETFLQNTNTNLAFSITVFIFSGNENKQQETQDFLK